MTAADAEPRFTEVTPIELHTALEDWCDENEPTIDSWQKRLGAGTVGCGNSDDGWISPEIH